MQGEDTRGRKEGGEGRRDAAAARAAAETGEGAQAQGAGAAGQGGYTLKSPQCTRGRVDAHSPRLTRERYAEFCQVFKLHSPVLH